MTAEPQLPTPASSSSSSSSNINNNISCNESSSTPVSVVSVDDFGPHKSTLSTAKLESSSSDCNGTAIIHTQAPAAASASAPAPRDDTRHNSYVFVPSYHDDSPLSLPLDDTNDFNKEDDPNTGPQESPLALSNGKLVTTTRTEFAAPPVIDLEDSLNKADDMGATTTDSYIEACGTDAFPSATQMIHQNSTVEASALHQLGHQQIDSEPSPESRPNHQDSQVSASILESDVDLVSASVLESDVDIAASLDAAKSTDVCNKPQEHSLVSISSLGDIGSESSEADISQSNSANQQNTKSFDDFVGLQESENGYSGAAHSDPQRSEVQFDTEPIPLLEGTVKLAVPPPIIEHLESSQSDETEQRIEEETKADLLSEAKESQQTIVEVGENAPSNLDQGSEDERSACEVDLISLTETATDTVLHHNKGHPHVPSFSDGLLKTKGLTEYSDESDKSLELDKSSSHRNALVPTPSFLQRETDTTDTEAKPIGNVQNREDYKFHVGASHITNDSAKEVCDPEMEDSINAAAQSSKKLLDIPGEDEIGTERPMAVDVQSLEKLPIIPTGHEIELEAPLPAESFVVGEDKVIDLVNTVSGNLEDAISSPVSTERSGIVLSDDVNGNDLGESHHNCSADSIARTEFELCLAGSSEKVLSLSVDNAHDTTKVGIMDVECSNTHCVPSHAEVKLHNEDINSSGTDHDRLSNSAHAYEIEFPDSSIATDESVPNSFPEIKDGEHQVDQLPVSDLESKNKLIGQEGDGIEKSHSNESSMSLLESSSADALAGKDVAVGLLTRPFQFLIRMPRFDDLKVREQIKNAQLLVDKKTTIRDGFRLEIQKLKANCRGLAGEYEVAVSNARSVKRSVKSKRAEIDALQVVINKVKNAISVDDIDARIYSMEHMIQHETLPLKEEKQFIREIKQLKQLRDQLSSNIGSQDEIQHAFSRREEIEDRLKILKKELDNLKDGVLKAEAVSRAAKIKSDDESKKLKELESQFEEANDIRQSVYRHLQSLKKELFEKNKQFRIYNNNANAASHFAASGNREALHHLCHNQVETIMDMWNKDDEFRKEYVKCNVRSTVRRLGTLDGRSLGPEEEPPVLTSYGIERLDRFVSNQSNISPMLQTPILKQEMQRKPAEDILTDDANKVKEREAKSQTEKNEAVTYTSGIGPATVSGKGVNDEISETEYIPSKEELELARKAEELRKEEAAAKLREHRRLEEKSKALEALERKKRNAEKAQIRAELRAQKEAEQKEKEREKRLRKKERKKVSGAEILDGNNSGDNTSSSEIVTETMKEPEMRDTIASAPKRPQKPSLATKQSKTKSIPPPLRNRSKRKMQQWMWVTITCVLVIFLFVLGNVGFFSNLSNLRQRSYRPS